MFYKKNIYYPQKVKGKFRKKGGYIVTREIAIVNNPTVSFNDEYYPKSILNFSTANNKNSSLHPTQKPIELCEYLIKTYTLENETVLDNCMGSGTTGIASKNLNRKFIGIEKEAKYYEIACQRCGF